MFEDLGKYLGKENSSPLKGENFVYRVSLTPQNVALITVTVTLELDIIGYFQFHFLL